jgi:hypothetical protein
VNRIARTALTALTVAAAAVAVAVTPAEAAPVTNRTIYAAQVADPGYLWKLTLNSTGAVTAKYRVAASTASRTLDVAGGRTLYARGQYMQSQIWIREPSGATRFLTRGWSAMFTPGRTGVFVGRHVETPGFPGFHDELVSYRLSDGRERHLLTLGGEDRFLDMKFSLDGRSVWFLRNSPEGLRFAYVGQYGIAEGRIIRNYELPSYTECHNFEMLPSGVRGIFACEDENGTPQVWTMRLATGAISRRTTLHGPEIDDIHGKLNDREMLASYRTRIPDGWAHRLGALDIETHALRRLPNGTGYRSGVAPY